MRVGVDRVRESRRQRLRKDFENLSFKSDEGIEDFALRISGVVSDLQSLGDGITELTAVQKFLRVVPSRYAQMACSIETLLDLEDMTVEELSGRLSAAREYTLVSACFLFRLSLSFTCIVICLVA